MSTIIRNAAKGQRSAMQSLYETNKAKVYYVAKSLLLDNKQACAVTVAAFKEAWHQLKSADVSTEADFSEHILMKVIGLCKGKAYQKNPKAFRIPSGKNFLLPINLAVKDDCANELAYLLGNLPVMHRYIFVLHTVCGFDELQIGRIMKCESGIITTAIETEPFNVERLQHRSSKKYVLSYDEIVSDLSKCSKELPSISAIDEQIAAIINAIATPVEEKAKKTKHTACVIGVLICACLLIAALIVFLPNDADISDVDDTSTSATDDTGAVTEDTDTTEDTSAAEDETTDETENVTAEDISATDETNTIEDGSVEDTTGTNADSGVTE